MTRAHVRLLGPCFKTGRIGDRLSHRDGVRSRSGATSKRRKRQVARDRPKRHRPATPPVPLAGRLTGDATEDLVLPAGQDTEAEAKGCYPTDRTAKAALSAHTDGKCTGRRRPHQNGASIRSRRPGRRRRPNECRRVSSALSASF
jgi:hypothetical protein